VNNASTKETTNKLDQTIKILLEYTEDYLSKSNPNTAIVREQLAAMRQQVLDDVHQLEIVLKELSNGH